MQSGCSIIFTMSVALWVFSFYSHDVSPKNLSANAICFVVCVTYVVLQMATVVVQCCGLWNNRALRFCRLTMILGDD